MSLVMAAGKVKNQFSTGQRGQIAVEYILLLIVGLTIWLALVNGLVSRNPQSPGVVIQKWVEIIKLIGSDQIEK